MTLLARLCHLMASFFAPIRAGNGKLNHFFVHYRKHSNKTGDS
jgi:hypothetical protein